MITNLRRRHRITVLVLALILIAIGLVSMANREANQVDEIKTEATS